MVTLSFPFLTPNITVLFSYNPHLSCQQVLQTPPSKYVWSVTLSLHFHCSLNYSSSLLPCICPHHSPLPPKINQSYCLFIAKHRSDSLKTSDQIPPPLPLPALLAVTPVSCSVFALTPLILTLLSWPPCPEPLGHLTVAPALAPPSVRSSLSRSAWAPHSRSAHTPSDQSSPPQCGLYFPPSLSIPLSSFLFLPVLSTCAQANFPYRLSSIMERNSRSFGSSQLSSLCPKQCLSYSTLSVNIC